jgi:hypothetical protein
VSKPLTHVELFTIIDCEDLPTLKKSFGEERYLQIIAKCDGHFTQLMRNKTRRALIASIDAASHPIEIWWSLISMIPFLAASPFVTLGCTIIPIVVGAMFFIFTYKKLHAKQNEIQDFFQLAILKFNAAKIILPKKDFDLDLNALIGINTQQVVSVPILPSFGISMGVGATLLVSYFWAISSILEIIGFASLSAALLGPTGITVAIILGVAVSLYFGYKHYKASENMQKINLLKNALSRELTRIDRACHCQLFKLKPIIQQSPPIKYIELQGGLKRPTQTELIGNKDITFSQSSLCALQRRNSV